MTEIEPEKSSQFWINEIAEHRCVLESVEKDIKRKFFAVLQIVECGVRGGGKILLFGNGGSAADAQHLAAELVVRLQRNRPAVPAIALTTDSSVLTACGNDFSFERIFSRQIEALAKKGDVVFGISTSGLSANVILGLQEAKRNGAATVGFSGGDGGKMQSVCDELLVVPSKITSRVQEMHILLGHMLCKALEERLEL